MSMNDPIASVLSKIDNYSKRGRTELTTKNNSKVIRKVLEIMKDQGFLGGFEEIEDAKGNVLKINLIGTINKTGVIKPRFSVSKEGFEKWEKRYLPARDFGLLLVSTSQGIMTHNEAKEKSIGGRLLSYVY